MLSVIRAFVIFILTHQYVWAGELYIFVSSSMPKSALVELGISAQQYDATLYLRGLKNNSFTDTASFVNDILQESGEGMSVDPTLFQKFNIQKTPCFVLSQKDRFDKVCGMLTLKAALTEIGKRGDLKTEAQKRLNHD